MRNAAAPRARREVRGLSAAGSTVTTGRRGWAVSRPYTGQPVRCIAVAICSLLLMASAAGAADAPSPDRYAEHSRLDYYIDDAGARRLVKTPADWAVRRGHILDGMQAAMG